MSKPGSGHFKGTTGTRNSSVQSDGKNDIIETKKKPEFVEHPTKYKQLSSKKLTILREKAKNRTITKEEYKVLQWHKRLNSRRNAGIKDFWDQEAQRIKHGKKATRIWNGEQIATIISGGRPKFRGRTMESHHTYSVAKYPHLANRGDLIYPATHMEHFVGWHGKSYRKSKPGKPINKLYEF